MIICRIKLSTWLWSSHAQTLDQCTALFTLNCCIALNMLYCISTSVFKNNKLIWAEPGIEPGKCTTNALPMLPLVHISGETLVLHLPLVPLMPRTNWVASPSISIAWALKEPYYWQIRFTCINGLFNMNLSWRVGSTQHLKRLVGQNGVTNSAQSSINVSKFGLKQSLL